MQNPPRDTGSAVDSRSDEALLQAIAAGPGSLPEFYRRHVAKIIGAGSRRFSEPEDVADFVASVFLEVMESAGTFDPRRGPAVAWLYGLAAHVAAQERRRSARAADAARRFTGRELLQTDDYERIEERIDAAAEARAVYAALEKLGSEDRRLLELVAVDGLTSLQAAEVLGVSRIAVRVRLSRARRRLRHVLEEASAHHPKSAATLAKEASS